VTSTPIKKITIEELKKQLRKLNLPTTGNKADLQQRLKNYEQTNEESNINSDTENVTLQGGTTKLIDSRLTQGLTVFSRINFSGIAHGPSLSRG